MQETPTRRQFDESFPRIGRKRANYEHARTRHKEMAIRNGATIAEAMKRINELLAEQSAVQAFAASEFVT